MTKRPSTELSELKDALKPSEEPRKKRHKMKNYDLMPAQVLNPMGASGVETVSLEAMAKTMAKGNKSVLYFTEFCDEHDARKGVAVSRLSEIQLAAGVRLRLQIYKDQLLPELYDAAMAEFATLEPSFKQLYGKDIQLTSTGESVGSIAYGSKTTGRVSAEVRDAAETIWNWTRQPTSRWRSLITLLGAGGLFYNTAVHEKVNRAYLTHGQDEPVTEEQYAGWCKERLCPDAPTECDDLAGLMSE